MTQNPAIFTVLLLCSGCFFAVSCYRRLSLIRIGKAEPRLDRIPARVRAALSFALGQKRVTARRFGLNHVAIFWAFLVLLLANAEFVATGVAPSLSLSLLPAPLHQLLLFGFDLASLLALCGVLVAMARRIVVRPPQLDTPYVKGRSFDAFLILSLVGALMAAYLVLHGSALALGREQGGFMPVSALLAKLLSPLPLQSLLLLNGLSWWLHALVLLGFLCFLPHSKHLHILTAIPNCFFASLDRPNTLPREDFSRVHELGAGQVDELSWKDLLDSFTCTECGRCQQACPAAATGKPLNPRQVVHAIKTNLLANASLLRSGKAGEQPRALPLIGAEGEGTNSEESIWSCTTCGACLAACPALIEQMPKIVKMRRHLVQMESRFPEELLNLFENMEQRSNPWGIAPSERSKWCGAQERPFEKGKTEYLLYVGCAGSFDSRNKQVSLALAAVLDAAGVSWGILGKEEKCCGDSVRRLGDEYLFDRMARDNAGIFRERGVTKVITQCPHCFSTLKNDYRQYGVELEVLHHSELISRLIAAGKLKLPRGGGGVGSVAFHDSCYLGRHNGIYEPPRQALLAATGKEPLELPRNREDSFCCGAGGGRMWLEEQTGTRINHNRVQEALAVKPDTICVSCPYCLTMFEDGLKDLQQGGVRVKDIAEVVAEGV
jgi:Fe-S oxidoreductase